MMQPVTSKLSFFRKQLFVVIGINFVSLAVAGVLLYASFVDDYRGLEVIPAAGTVIGHDGDRAVPTPYDNCVLIMPSRRLRKGESAVRFGRFISD